VAGWLVIQLLLWLYDWSSKIGCEVRRSNIVLVGYWSRIVGHVLVGPILVVNYDNNTDFDSHGVGCTKNNAQRS